MDVLQRVVFAALLGLLVRTERLSVLGLSYNTLAALEVPAGTVFNEEDDAEGIRRQCKALARFDPRQGAWCKEHYPFMKPIVQGTRLGLDECARQFKFRAWNCPIKHKDALKASLSLGTPETAFLQAVQAAGILQAISRTCSRGNVSHWCGCDTPPDLSLSQNALHLSSAGEKRSSFTVHDKSDKDSTKSDGKTWIWGGCGDNLEMGYKLARDFLGHKGPFTRETDAKEAMTQHNYEAGRKAVEAKMTTRCKCVGLTGACTTKICWRSLPTIQRVGKRLMKYYLSAKQVKLTRKEGGSLALTPIEKDFGETTKEDLVYKNPPPNYCIPNVSVGSLGTKGRECKEKSKKEDGCELLCCGRGSYPDRHVRTSKCHCRFVWCCRVQCNTCIKATEKYICL